MFLSNFGCYLLAFPCNSCRTTKVKSCQWYLWGANKLLHVQPTPCETLGRPYCKLYWSCLSQSLLDPDGLIVRFPAVIIDAFVSPFNHHFICLLTFLLERSRRKKLKRLGEVIWSTLHKHAFWWFPLHRAHGPASQVWSQKCIFKLMFLSCYCHGSSVHHSKIIFWAHLSLKSHSISFLPPGLRKSYLLRISTAETEFAPAFSMSRIFWWRWEAFAAQITGLRQHGHLY